MLTPPSHIILHGIHVKATCRAQRGITPSVDGPCERARLILASLKKKPGFPPSERRLIGRQELMILIAKMYQYETTASQWIAINHIPNNILNPISSI